MIWNSDPSISFGETDMRPLLFIYFKTEPSQALYDSLTRKVTR